MSKKLLDEVRTLMRRRHYSIHTEKSYCSWIKRYVAFHQMRSREDLKDGEKKIEQFLTHLAVDRQVAPSTQNQAINDLEFSPNASLYNEKSLNSHDYFALEICDYHLA